MFKLSDIRMRKELARRQRVCPVTGLRVWGGEHLHHWLVGRMKGHPELDVPELNLLLVRPEAHVPPHPELDYLCAKLALALNPPEVIEAWLKSLPFKVKPALPKGYVKARDEL